MKPILHNRLAAGVALMCLAIPAMQAKTGAPHTVSVQPNFTDVSLEWCAPSADKELKWHNNQDYNGDTAPETDTQKAVKTYVAAKFTAEDLVNSVGEKIEAISFFQYRPIYKVTVYVYENGKPVSQAAADPTSYVKNTWQKVYLPSPVEIEAGKEYMFVVCHEHGANVDFVAIKDNAADAVGKGDLLSTDGVDWIATGNGEYLITANLANDVDEEPDGYNVYRGTTKLNDDLITETSATFADQPEGKYSFTVSAVYGQDEVKSGQVDAEFVAVSSLLPSPTILSSSVNVLDVSLTWAQPPLGGNELGWTDKSINTGIGGTASSNTKVWVRNQFSPADLIAYSGGKISAVNYYFTEAVISSVTVFIIKDGVIDYHEAMPESAIASIAAGSWSKFPLSEPYQLEDGHEYAYGLYVLHTPKTHPMGVDNSTPVDVKGNSFSVSSPNSTDFSKSKPSWKTLLSGGIYGNWLMYADITDAPAAIADPSYDVYRDGQLLRSGLTDRAITDPVDDLGTYTYTVVSRSGDKTSLPAAKEVTVKLPASYSAPLMENYSFDNDTKELNIVWNMDKEISHCGSAAYLASFDEEMAMMWGTQFTADELAAYNGYTITKLKFMIGAETGDLRVGVYSTKGVPMSEVEIPANTLTPQAVYTVTLPTPVEITGDKDLVFAYSATVPAEAGAVVIDEGPLVTNGAKISLTDGLTWLNLSTLNPTYGQYNIFISAMASEGANADQQSAQCVEIGHAEAMVTKAAKVDKIYGVEAEAETAAPRRAAAAAPKVDHFNIYCNNEKVADTKEYSYNETVKRFASFEYYVTTVYNNGWESPASGTVSFTNHVAQKAVAPYGLTGTKSGNDLQLEWQSPDKSVVLTYVPEDAKLLSLRMTGSSTLTSYCASKFTKEELADHVGDCVSHIQFGVGNININSAVVFVMFNENIVYTQTVPMSTLTTGVNDIRLNEPVKITEGQDMAVGFIMNYASSTSIAPLGCFACEDHAGLGDLISSSASVGMWKSLQTNLKSNYCWYIKGILAKGDNEVAKAQAVKAPAETSYNVYRNGEKIASVSETSYTVEDAEAGMYHVTAVSADGESGESNVVAYGTAGIDNITADGQEAIIYDRATATVVFGAEAQAEVYNAAGALVAGGNGLSLSLAGQPAGVYVVRAAFANGSAVAKIVR